MNSDNSAEYLLAIQNSIESEKLESIFRAQLDLLLKATSIVELPKIQQRDIPKEVQLSEEEQIAAAIDASMCSDANALRENNMYKAHFPAGVKGLDAGTKYGDHGNMCGFNCMTVLNAAFGKKSTLTGPLALKKVVYSNANADYKTHMMTDIDLLNVAKYLKLHIIVHESNGSNSFGDEDDFTVSLIHKSNHFYICTMLYSANDPEIKEIFDAASYFNIPLNQVNVVGY